MFLAQVNPLQASIFSSLAIVSLLLTFVMLGSHWLRNYVYAFAVQSWLIAALSLSVGYFAGYRELYVIAALTALFRGLILPYLLMCIITRLNVKRELHAILQPSSSLVVGAYLVMFAFVISNHMNREPAPAAHVVILALTIMLSMKFLDFLILSVRDEAVSQILGLLVRENGIFLGSQILVPGMPLLIEIVILFDLLIVVACFGMLVRFLVVHAGTTSSRKLNRLVDSGVAAEADTNQSKTLNYLKPRIVLTLTPDKTDHLRFRAEHEVSQLDFTDFVAASSLVTGSVRSGNTNIVPQQDWVLEGLYEHHFWFAGDLVLTYRHFFLSDVLDRVPVYSQSDPSSVFDAPGNIGGGSEDAAIANLTIPLDRLGARQAQLKLTAVQQWSAVTDPTTAQIRPLSGLNPLEYEADFLQNVPRWHMNWGASFLTPCAKSSTVKGCTETQYRFDEIDTYRATPALNLFTEFRPWKGVLLHIEGDNILRQHYDWDISTYSGPRDAFLVSTTDSRRLTSFDSVLISLRKEF